MQQLHHCEPTELSDEQQRVFNSIYVTQQKSSYLPEVLLFLPMPLLLFIILIGTYIGFSRNTISMLWLTLFCNAFIFIFVFLKIFTQLPKDKRNLTSSYRIVSVEGFLIESTVSSVNRTFFYFEEFTGNRVPVINIRREMFPMEESGKAIIIEEFPGQYALLDFKPAVEILNSEEDSNKKE